MIPYPDVWLLTLEDLQAFLGLSDEEVVEERDSLIRAIVQASADTTAYLRRLPLAHVREMEFEPPRSRFLVIESDLLEVIELVNPAGSTLTTADYRLKPLNEYPKTRVELLLTNCGSWEGWCGSQFATGELTARFGYVPHWDYAWETIMSATLAADVTTLAVPTVSLFRTGDTLRFENEYLFVRNIVRDASPATSGTLTLKRGVLGTTSVAHAISTPVSRFLILDVIRTNAIEWAAYLEKSRERVGDRVQVSEQGLLIVNDLSPLVKEALSRHQYNPTAQIP